MQFRSMYLKFIAVFILLIGSAATWAQTITGGVNGIVTDPSGAVIPNARVQATNVDTGVVTETTTNDDGVYNLRFLQIGNYKVTVTATGFGTTVFGPFALETNQNAKIDAKLALENQQQKVTVEAQISPLINTESPVLSTTLDTRAIENVPLVSRNIVALTMFLPGAVSTNPNGFVNQGAVSGPLSSSGPVTSNTTVSVNGNRQQANQYLLDGMNINQTLDDILGYNPSVDAIGQVQVISANAPAEYGNVLGGDILFQTKSGTNQFHGSAFYFLGNYNLNANSWVNQHTTPATPKNSFTRNLFGGTFGGPILKDKLFFFVDYQGGRYHLAGPTQATVLTTRQRQGDFSELLDPNIMCTGTETTAAACTAKLIQLYDATAPGAPAYPNNRIPVGNNPALNYLLQHPELYPLPNQTPNRGSPALNNYRGQQKLRNYGDQMDARVDWKATERDNVSGRFSWGDFGQTTINPLPISFASAPTFPVRGVAINAVHTFNASMVNEFRAGYTRIQNNGAVLLDPTGVFGLNGNSILGIGSNDPASQAQAFAGFSALAMSNSASPQGFTASNGTEYTTLGNANLGTNYTLNTFLYGDNFTWLKDRHTFKFGVQFLRQQQNNFYPGNDGSLGGFYFLGAGTASPTVAGATGYTAADFMLNRAGFVSKGGVAGPVGMRSWRSAYFAQDDWKVTPTLTVNLGVRYEYVQPIYEVNNKMSTIDPNNPSVILLAGSPQAEAAGYSRALVDAYYGSVMPRIGFAFSPTTRWVIRGGYGLQNYMEGTGANLRMTTNLPFQSSYQASGNQASATSPGSFFIVQNGFSNPAAGPAASGAVYNVWNKKIKPAFINMYNLTLEYQLSSSASVQVGYLGESGQHLITANRRNQLRNPCVVNGAFVDPATPTPSAACLAQAPAPFYATPGVGYNGNIRYTDSNAMMNYNALQASVRQRLSRGLQYMVNYTYGRAMTNSIGFYGAPSINNPSPYAENVYNMHNEYGPAGQDVRHAVNWNIVYDLPFGRNRQFAANMPIILDQIVGGWKIGMTGVAYSGFPVNMNTSSNNSFVNSGSQRANHYRKLRIVDRSIDNWFGTDPSAIPCTTPGVDNGVCAYGQPANGTFGTAPPLSERAPSFQTYGASVTKDFTIWHEQQINFRADADNVFNSAYLGNPVSNIQSSQFGNISNQATPVRSGPRNLQLSVKYHF
ncbi:TonB-dependent receptor [Edaphobacter aggregans]|uniref:TonB-dependent receptor n=1 Tax=Edaphobacter aggregans TaxID=570835 RepID=UPI00068CE897|nr:carboxypeptidase regulatory-like domain-containing protein [Edaphobacter aggregans]